MSHLLSFFSLLHTFLLPHLLPLRSPLSSPHLLFTTHHFPLPTLRSPPPPRPHRGRYSAINGTPSCANDYLLKTLVRGEWGFDGYITSDCSALTNIGPASGHKWTNSTDATCAAALGAGCDIGCDGMYQVSPAVDNANVVSSGSTFSLL